MRIVRMTLECLSPLHCGGGEESWLQDQPVVRDAFGCWYIPGTSITGTLRAIAERLDRDVAASLFGGERASLFWASDARLLDYDGRPVLDKLLAGEEGDLPSGPFLRDHVRLDCESETAEHGGKFDEEIVPSGTRFALELTFDPWDRTEVEKELALFDQLCALAAQGVLSLGGKGTNGLGRYRALTTECRDFDLTTFTGMQDWLRLSSHAGFSEKDGGIPVVLPKAPVIERKTGFSGMLEIALEADGPLIVGGGSSLTADDDIVFATTPSFDYAQRCLVDRFVIPGSSVKGAFRHAMYRICLARGLDGERAQALLRPLFGHADGDTGQRGKLSFHEADLGAARPLSVPHVAIDRFSGGALDGALFSEGPVWRPGMPVRISITLDGLEPHEAALLFHALFDLADGALPLGGGIGRGCGRFVLRAGTENPIQRFAAWTGALYQDGEALRFSDADAMFRIFAQLDEALNKVLEAWKKRQLP